MSQQHTKLEVSDIASRSQQKDLLSTIALRSVHSHSILHPLHNELQSLLWGAEMLADSFPANLRIGQDSEKFKQICEWMNKVVGEMRKNPLSEMPLISREIFTSIRDISENLRAESVKVQEKADPDLAELAGDVTKMAIKVRDIAQDQIDFLSPSLKKETIPAPDLLDFLVQCSESVQPGALYKGEVDPDASLDLEVHLRLLARSVAECVKNSRKRDKHSPVRIDMYSMSEKESPSIEFRITDIAGGIHEYHTHLLENIDPDTGLQEIFTMKGTTTGSGIGLTEFGLLALAMGATIRAENAFDRDSGRKGLCIKLTVPVTFSLPEENMDDASMSGHILKHQPA